MFRSTSVDSIAAGQVVLGETRAAGNEITEHTVAETLSPKL